MNRHTFSFCTAAYHVMVMCVLAMMTACSDDIDNEVVGNKVYTLNLAIDETDISRNATNGFPVKSRWCYGDKVTLTSAADPNARYEFTVYKPNGKNIGDPVDERVATFTHTGNIPGATSFTGTVEYVPAESEQDVYPWGDTQMVKSYLVQQANDDASHIACLNVLNASLENTNLTASQTILLKRSFGLIKVVMSGFIYPLTYGSGLWIHGFEHLHSGDDNPGLGVVLGNWAGHHTVTQNDDRETLSGAPFFAVSDDKDPLTGYAIDDGRELVAYVPFTTERKVQKNKKLSVTVMDEWSNDIYVWSVKLPFDMDYKVGNCYTLDLSYIEPDIAVDAVTNVIQTVLEERHFGYIRTKNIGAETPADVGNYYMLGWDEPIKPGEHYPGYPNDTPFYYYKQHSSGQETIYKRGLAADLYSYIFLSVYATSGLIQMYRESAVGEYKYLGELWRKFAHDGFDAVQSGASEWSIVKHAGTPVYRGQIFYDNEIVNPDGTVATNKQQAAGMRMTIRRTGHVVYFPAGGVLEPSELTTNELETTIAPDAVAVPWSSADQNIVVFVQEGFAKRNNPDRVEILMDGFNMNCEPVRCYVPLYDAITIRPIYCIYGKTPRQMMMTVRL